MPTATKEPAARSEPKEPANERRRPRPIVVATEGTDDGDAAVKLGAALIKRVGAPLHVFSVIEGVVMGSDLPTMYPLTPLPPVSDLMVAGRTRRMEKQCERLFGARLPTTVRVGSIAREMAIYTRDTGARFVITGRGRHTLTERLLGDEYLGQLLLGATCPVLASAPSLRGPPMRVVIGCDFGGHDLEIARVAMSIMAADARVFFVHVGPVIQFDAPAGPPWSAAYEKNVYVGLQQLRDALDLPRDRVEVQALRGHPGRSLLEFSDRVKADMTVVGTHGAGFVHRLVIGSTTAYLLRTALCSLLTVRCRRTPGHQPASVPSDPR